ncbi:hypothetical protein SerAS12_3089 [Serratia sp. AS12]|uniref:glycoside hydrolase family 75 protein n=1 Tax=Serratia TaxID=613 RepID=UPI00020E9DEA|nr:MULTISPECIES: glycoside hydrolase family 75 protein [Serratia]AEF46206.1 hypothetical protein SerAS9_3088 [Serratia plymuthica AS9]AEF51158.1 hypothetical protein SerAS12_3089 [Serratia sp. AS12]AEG28866.1 hypothetical protein SerAS13_3091 [Serratia sp. AS13]UTN94940.1 glycoside hydrolase family 75 protein [Serratia plymuthica]
MPKLITHAWKNHKVSPDEPTIPDPVVMIKDNDHILIIADADTDADGSPDAKEIDATGQIETSLRKRKDGTGWQGEGDYVNARVIPYYVIPGNWRKVSGIDVKMGDLAKLSYNDRSVYAICADVGGEKYIGEASIAAIEALGGNPWGKGKKKIISGLDYGVTYEIVAGSASLSTTLNFETIQAYGRELFNENLPFSIPLENSKISAIELSTDKNGRPTVIISSESGGRIVKGYSDTFELGLILQSLPRVKVKSIPGLPLESFAEFIELADSHTEKFVGLFKNNYGLIREEVEDWFVPAYSPTATRNGCVAHQVSCLKLCALPYPKLGSRASINVDDFAEWTLSNGWTKITKRAALIAGDICVSGPRGHLTQFDHVYCFVSLSEYHPGYASIFDNQHFGIHLRSLDGDGSAVGEWRYALRMTQK